MINKNEFQITNNKKVLHKKGKQWITISLAMLALLGGSAIASKTMAHADQNVSQISLHKAQTNGNSGDNHQIGNQKPISSNSISSVSNSSSTPKSQPISAGSSSSSTHNSNSTQVQSTKLDIAPSSHNSSHTTDSSSSKSGNSNPATSSRKLQQGTALQSLNHNQAKPTKIQHIAITKPKDIMQNAKRMHAMIVRDSNNTFSAQNHKLSDKEVLVKNATPQNLKTVEPSQMTRAQIIAQARALHNKVISNSYGNRVFRKKLLGKPFSDMTMDVNIIETTSDGTRIRSDFLSDIGIGSFTARSDIGNGYRFVSSDFHGCFSKNDYDFHEGYFDDDVTVAPDSTPGSNSSSDSYNPGGGGFVPQPPSPQPSTSQVSVTFNYVYHEPEGIGSATKNIGSTTISGNQYTNVTSQVVADIPSGFQASDQYVSGYLFPGKTNVDIGVVPDSITNYVHFQLSDGTPIGNIQTFTENPANNLINEFYVTPPSDYHIVGKDADGTVHYDYYNPDIYLTVAISNFTNTINYTYDGKTIASTKMTGTAGSSYTITNDELQNTAPGWSLSNDGTQNLTYDGESHSVSITPAIVKDTVNYQYNGKTIGYYQPSGNDYRTGINGTFQPNNNSVPAGWHETENPTINYDGGQHDVDIAPNQVTDVITYQDNDTGDNSQGHDFEGKQGSTTIILNDNRATQAGDNNWTVTTDSKPTGLAPDFHVIGNQTFSHNGGYYNDTVYVARDQVQDNLDDNDEGTHQTVEHKPLMLFADADYNLGDIANQISLPSNEMIATPSDLTTAFHTRLLGEAPQTVNLPVFNLQSLENSIATSTAAQYASITNSASNAISSQSISANSQVNSINARFQSYKNSESIASASSENSKASSAASATSSLVNSINANTSFSTEFKNNTSANSAINNDTALINSLIADMKAHPNNIASDTEKITIYESQANSTITSATNSASVSSDLQSASSSATSSEATKDITDITNDSTIVNNDYTDDSSALSADEDAENIVKNAESAIKHDIDLANQAKANGNASLADSYANDASNEVSKANSATDSASASANTSNQFAFSANTSASVALQSTSNVVNDISNYYSSAIIIDPDAKAILTSVQNAINSDIAKENQAIAQHNGSLASSYANDASNQVSKAQSAGNSAGAVSSTNSSALTQITSENTVIDDIINENQSGIDTNPSAKNELNHLQQQLTSLINAETSARTNGQDSLANSYANDAENDASKANSVASSANSVSSTNDSTENVITSNSTIVNNIINNVSASNAIATDPSAQTAIKSIETDLATLVADEKSAKDNGDDSLANSYANQADTDASKANSIVASATSASSENSSVANAISNSSETITQIINHNQALVTNNPQAKALMTEIQKDIAQDLLNEESAWAKGETSSASSYADDATKDMSSATSVISSATSESSANSSAVDVITSNSTVIDNISYLASNAIATDPSASTALASIKNAVASILANENSANAKGNGSLATSYADEANNETSSADSVASMATTISNANSSATAAINDDNGKITSLINQYQTLINSNPQAKALIKIIKNEITRDIANEQSAYANGKMSSANAYAQSANDIASSANLAISSALSASSTNNQAISVMTGDSSNVSSMSNNNSVALNADALAKQIMIQAQVLIASAEQAERSAMANGNASSADSYLEAVSNEASIAESAINSAASSASVSSQNAYSANSNAQAMISSNQSATNSLATNNQSAINDDPTVKAIVESAENAINSAKTGEDSASAKDNGSLANSYAQAVLSNANALISAIGNADTAYQSNEAAIQQISQTIDDIHDVYQDNNQALDTDQKALQAINADIQQMSHDKALEQQAMVNGNPLLASSYVNDTNSKETDIKSQVSSATSILDANSEALSAITSNSTITSNLVVSNNTYINADTDAKDIIAQAEKSLSADVTKEKSAEANGEDSSASAYSADASAATSEAQSATDSARTSYTVSNVVASGSIASAESVAQSFSNEMPSAVGTDSTAVTSDLNIIEQALHQIEYDKVHLNSGNANNASQEANLVSSAESNAQSASSSSNSLSIALSVIDNDAQAGEATDTMPKIANNDSVVLDKLQQIINQAKAKLSYDQSHPSTSNANDATSQTSTIHSAIQQAYVDSESASSAVSHVDADGISAQADINEINTDVSNNSSQVDADTDAKTIINNAEAKINQLKAQIAHDKTDNDTFDADQEMSQASAQTSSAESAIASAETSYLVSNTVASGSIANANNTVHSLESSLPKASGLDTAKVNADKTLIEQALAKIIYDEKHLNSANAQNASTEASLVNSAVIDAQSASASASSVSAAQNAIGHANQATTDTGTGVPAPANNDNALIESAQEVISKAQAMIAQDKANPTNANVINANYEASLANSALSAAESISASASSAMAYITNASQILANNTVAIDMNVAADLAQVKADHDANEIIQHEKQILATLQARLATDSHDNDTADASNDITNASTAVSIVDSAVASAQTSYDLSQAVASGSIASASSAGASIAETIPMPNSLDSASLQSVEDKITSAENKINYDLANINSTDAQNASIEALAISSASLDASSASTSASKKYSEASTVASLNKQADTPAGANTVIINGKNGKNGMDGQNAQNQLPSASNDDNSAISSATTVIEQALARIKWDKAHLSPDTVQDAIYETNVINEAKREALSASASASTAVSEINSDKADIAQVSANISNYATDNYWVLNGDADASNAVANAEKVIERDESLAYQALADNDMSLASIEEANASNTAINVQFEITSAEASESAQDADTDANIMNSMANAKFDDTTDSLSTATVSLSNSTAYDVNSLSMDTNTSSKATRIIRTNLTDNGNQTYNNVDALVQMVKDFSNSLRENKYHLTANNQKNIKNIGLTLSQLKARLNHLIQYTRTHTKQLGGRKKTAQIITANRQTMRALNKYQSTYAKLIQVLRDKHAKASAIQRQSKTFAQKIRALIRLNNYANKVMQRIRPDNYQFDTLGNNQSIKYGNAVLTRKHIRHGLFYVLPKRRTYLYDGPSGARSERIKRLVPQIASVMRIRRIYRYGNTTMIEITYHHHDCFVKARDMQNAYLQPADIKPVSRIKLIRPAFEYKRRHYTKKGRIKILKRGKILRYRKLETIAKYHMTRLQLMNGNWITANKNYVKVIR